MLFVGEIRFSRNGKLLQAETLVTVSPCEFPPRSRTPLSCPAWRGISLSYHRKKKEIFGNSGSYLLCCSTYQQNSVFHYFLRKFVICLLWNVKKQVRLIFLKNRPCRSTLSEIIPSNIPSAHRGRWWRIPLPLRNRVRPGMRFPRNFLEIKFALRKGQ